MVPKRFCPYCGQPIDKLVYEKRLRLFCHSCQLPIYENPIPAACMVVMDSGNKILLVKRLVEPKAGSWCLPGGFMELDETPEQCALRELEEESGLIAEAPILLGALTNNSNQYKTVLVIGYLVKRFRGKLKAGDDADAVQWFELNQMPEIAFSSHRRFIKIASEKKI